MTRCPGMGELGAEEHDQGRVIDPHEQHHHRACRAVCRAHAGLAKVKTDGRLAEGKERRRDKSAQPYVTPADLGIWHVLVEQSKDEGEDEERDGKFQQPTEEGSIRSFLRCP